VFPTIPTNLSEFVGMLYQFPPETPLLSSYDLSAGLQVALPPRSRTYVQMQSKVHKPPLKVNHFATLPTIDFRNVRRTRSSRRDVNSGLCDAKLGSASRCEQEWINSMVGVFQEAA
jgi:hypothetical protein